MATNAELYIGLMSGTSLDGVDVVLADFATFPPELIAHRQDPYPEPLRARLLQLANAHSADIEELGQLGVQLGKIYADSVNQLMRDHPALKAQVRAVGCHGQTIRHCPQASYPFTWQLGDASVVAEHSGITTVGQFRQRDIAAGGQGAPLVPAFHQYLFRSPERNRVLLNIGGMANITWLPARSAQLLGFDTGPGNALIDGWCQQFANRPYDKDGDMARGGSILPNLLEALLAHPYFAQPAPKSTGREAFHWVWLDQVLEKLQINANSIDVLTTVTELTARTITDAVHQMGPTDDLILCGGGAYNGYLVERLRLHMGAATQVATSQDFGVAPETMEATAFAWLARQTMLGLPGNHPAVTGAKGFRILGAIFPA